MDLSSDGIAWDNIVKTLSAEGKAGGTATDNVARVPGREPRKMWPLPVTGAVRVDAKSFTYRRFVWKPARVDFLLAKESIDATVREADLCGIATTGTVKITPTDTALDIRGVSAGHDITETAACVQQPSIAMTGRQSRYAPRARERPRTVPVPSGFGGFPRGKGRIHKANLLSKILAVLNVTQLFFGKLPDREIKVRS
jgi:hypothetical protein